VIQSVQRNKQCLHISPQKGTPFLFKGMQLQCV